jgi:hypothetical protein
MIEIKVDYSSDKVYKKLKKIIIKNIKSIFPNKYSFKYKTQKHDVSDIVDAIVFILRNDINYTRMIINNIPGKTLNTHINFLSKVNIFETTYKQLLRKYLKKSKCNKLKYQSIDTSYIYNSQCGENLKRNTNYKGKKGIKISAIVDSNGIPISILAKDANEYDSTFVEDNFDKLLIDADTIKYKGNNKNKQYFLADKGYDSKKVRELVSKKGYIYICPQNKRNIKTESKIVKFSENYKEKYRKRIIVENFFSWIKKNKRLQLIREKYVNTFMMFINVANILIIHKNIYNY